MQDKINKIFEELVEVVGSTMGPDGKNVLVLEKDVVKSYLTKDGVTVAKNFHYTPLVESEILEMAEKNAILKIIVEMARKTDLSVGDGTTSTIVFAGSLYNLLVGLCREDLNLVDVLDGAKAALKLAKAAIPKHAKVVRTIEEIGRIAYVSSNNDQECADILTSTFNAIGKSGTIMFSKNNSPKKTEINIKTGFHFPAGYVGRGFINYPEKKTCEFQNPYYMITDYPITQANQVLQALALVEASKRPLVIVCDLIDGEAIAFLVEGNIKNKFQVAVIQAPYYGNDKVNFFEDFALFVDGKYISQREHTAIPVLKLDELGESDAIEIGHKGTVVLGSTGIKEKIKAHVDYLKKTIVESSDDVEIESIHQRIIRFGSGAAEIQIGGSTETEVKERRDRLQDALRACNNSFMEGYVAGGGLIFLHCAKYLKEMREEQKLTPGELVGYDAVLITMDCILRRLIKNSNINLDRYGMKQDIKDHIVDNLDNDVGFDFKNKEFKNFLNPEVLIIEPAGIAREILENSASIVGLLLNTKYSV